MSNSSYAPPVGFHFDVRILGEFDQLETLSAQLGLSAAIDGKFTEVSGISSELITETFVEGGENRFTHRLPKHHLFTPLKLKRGLVVSPSALSSWISTCMHKGTISPVPLKHIVITLLNEDQFPIAGWFFVNAFPVKYQLSDLNAQKDELAIETIEFSYQRFEKINL